MREKIGSMQLLLEERKGYFNQNTQLYISPIFFRDMERL